MADITGDSPQAVALRLLEVIADAEGKTLGDPSKGANKAYVLNTYKECIKAVLNVRRWGPYSSP